MLKRLLLSPAKGILVHTTRRERYIRNTAVAIGIGAVLVGLADISSRLAQGALGSDAAFETFAPAAALDLQHSTNIVAVEERIKIPAVGIDELATQAGSLLGLAGLHEGDYITVLRGSKAQVYTVKSVTIYHLSEAPNTTVPQVSTEKLVLMSPERDVVVVATPAY